ncbi:MAG TPA: adenylate/guanylate cyclase domain-containing protein [Aggregatilinea sp.]|uniref:GAF domain-containing protein n=1 Tax=Aggregatilinea sp. TaxID=2806333 RepID=UPI002C1A00E1|nr:adenylate/guanylate cyclase domain-containing protein [Aggregatilinea sp.]HML20411.1 adenylate/guanylate cyclase domain-containing protein [Aggregatilinea sp.]
MSEPNGRPPVEDEIKWLLQATTDLIDVLRVQRDFLRQHGMTLPPGSLNVLRSVQMDLENFSRQIINASVELSQLRALAETTALVNSSLDLNQVLNEVMDKVVALTGAERGYIVLRDEQTGQMEFRVARNLDRETIDEGGFIVSRTVVEEVAATGQPVVTTNAQSDPRFSHQQSVMLHALRSVLCVPLTVKGEVTGVVYADNRVRDGLFGEQELSLLVSFANQAAIAIENARLYRRVQITLSEVTEIKEMLDNVFTSIASGVITTDIYDTITTYNAAAERILALPHDRVLGHTLAEALPALYHPIADALARVYAQSARETIDMELNLRSRGKVSLNLKLTPLKDEDETQGIAIVVEDLTEIKRRDATLDMVRRYLPPTMIDNIQSIDGLGLGGERRVITVMFVEMRPFSSFPAHLSPQDLMAWLNLYLTAGAEVIHQNAGVIDKFMGNEIMVLFNTQLNPQEHHAWAAVNTALRLTETCLALADQLGEEAVPYYRIGMHTGVATLGNVGSATRRDFTAIGDSVNLAKRLQENAEQGQIIISEDTYRHCAEKLIEMESRLSISQHPAVQVRGRRQTTTVYEVRVAS